MEYAIETQTSRIRETAEKIIAFKELRPGWYHGGGTTPGSDAIQNALKLNEALGRVGFTRTSAFSGIDGEVRVTAYHKSTYLEFTIEPDGLITFVHEEGGIEQVCEEGITFRDALKRIQRFWERIWVTFESSSGGGTTPRLSVSKHLLSDLPVIEVYPSLTKNAYYDHVQKSVNISKDFIRRNPEPLLSFGT